MNDILKPILIVQLEAALCMLAECIEKCTPAHWDQPIAKYPFWMVAYHTLCCTDVYLSPNEQLWQPRQDSLSPGGGLHPRGKQEIEEEFPSRRFEQAELIEYAAICRALIRQAIEAETPESLQGPCGFSWLSFSRVEVHIYNARHIQHHAGQLGASLRRVGVQTSWVKSGWR